jgi:Zn-dependent protease with chaperone function
MPRQDSFLHLLVKLGIHDSHPELAERLATEDIIIPSMPCAIRVAEWLHEVYECEIHTTPGDEPTKSTAQSADEPAKPKWPPVPRPSIFRDPNGYMNARHKENLLRRFEPPPPALDHLFEGMTDLEKGVAWDLLAIGGSIAGPGNHEDLDQWIAEVSRRERIVKPRLVIMEDDYPQAAAQSAPGEIPSVFISTNLLDILPERQMKALIAHELGHIREKQKPLLCRNVHSLLDRIRGKSPNWQREYRADAFSARVTGSPEDMVDGLTTVTERNRELRRFARQVTEVCKEYDFDMSRYGIVDLEHVAHVRMQLFPKATAEERRRDMSLNDHPSYVERFDALFENDRHPTKGTPSR